ncbi:TPA: hypothetical protein DCW54_00135 [Candidatus Dependentiae bacterium]|nr:hypothetical protein [Candidatus Dependentiae bacterium]
MSPNVFLLFASKLLRYSSLLFFFALLFWLNLPIFGTILVAIAICILFGYVVSYAWFKNN